MSIELSRSSAGRTVARGRPLPKLQAPWTRSQPRATTTSIAAIFHWELAVLRIAGGLSALESSKHLALAYRTTLILATNYLALSYFVSYPKAASQYLSKASNQNALFFWFTWLATSLVARLTTLYTGYKYRNVIAIVLRKRLDIRYLADGDRSGARAMPIGDGRSRDSQLALVGRPAGSSRGLPSRPVRSKPLSACERLDRWALFSASKIKTLRFVLALSLALSVTTSYLRDELSRPLAGAGIAPAKPPLPPLVQAPRNPPPANGTWPAGSFNMLRAFLPQLFNTSVAALGRNSTSSTNWRQFNSSALAGSVYRSIRNDRAMSFGQLVELRLAAWSRPARATAVFAGHLVYNALADYQTYGHIFTGLMIAATLAEMLKKSLELCNETAPPGLGRVGAGQASAGGERRRAARNSPASLSSSSSAASSRVSSSRSASPVAGNSASLSAAASVSSAASSFGRGDQLPPGRPATQLLIQVRDVLAALRVALSLDYLVLLLFDISRLMYAFCLFSAFIAADKLPIAGLIFVEYLRVSLAVFTSRLGYHWLHSEVRKIRLASERLILGGAVGAATLDQLGQWSAGSANSGAPAATDASRADLLRIEATSTLRLANEIENLWPTDWLTPDMKSFVAENFFVITFVATLQQLVDAGSKVEASAAAKFRDLGHNASGSE